MSMSMHLAFFRSPDDPDMRKKLDAAYACDDANLELPPALTQWLAPVTEEYGGLPGDRDEAIDALLAMGPSYEGQEAYEWRDDSSKGYEIDLSKLPEGVSKIRFYCSW